MKKQYAIKYTSLMSGIRIVGDDLEFLCSMLEDPTEEYKIPDAVEFSNAIVCLHNQLSYMMQDIDFGKLSEDGELVILSREQVMEMGRLSDSADEAVARLRDIGISLKNN